jgi:hypothetical protein
MIRLCLVLFFAFAFTFTNIVSSEGQPGIRTTDTIKVLDKQDCKVLLIFARLWRNSPLVERENAVWIVVNSKGEYETIDWPRTVQ